MPPTPLTDEEVARTLGAVEDAMRYRLRMIDVIPLEMSNYHIGKVLLSTLRALALILLKLIANMNIHVFILTCFAALHYYPYSAANVTFQELYPCCLL